MIELERTYLVKELPTDLQTFPCKEMLDIYIPRTSDHPDLRIRKNGDRYEITRKRPLNQGDASQQLEQTIVLDHTEFQELARIPGKRIQKTRFTYPYRKWTLEIDVFQGPLNGLVLVDVEFATLSELEAFIPPAWFSTEVTKEPLLAGGMLAGKSFEEIKDKFDKENKNVKARKLGIAAGDVEPLIHEYRRETKKTGRSKS